MILVDSSIWVDHFRSADQVLSGLIERGTAMLHPFVLGELAMGNLPHWQRTVAGLNCLPRSDVAGETELIAFVHDKGLPGSGLGFVDAHLLAAVAARPALKLWSRDKRLAAQAAGLGVGWSPAG